jgi:hypothetical protein
VLQRDGARRNDPRTSIPSKTLWILKETGDVFRNSEVLIIDGEDENETTMVAKKMGSPRATSPRMSWSI